MSLKCTNNKPVQRDGKRNKIYTSFLNPYILAVVITQQVSHPLTSQNIEMLMNSLNCSMD